MTYVPIPLPPHILLAIGLLLALFVMSGLVVLMLMPKEVTKREALSTVQTRMGLRMMHPAVFVLGAMFWGVLFGLLFVGLIWTIFGLIWGPLPSPERLPGQTSAIWNWRFSLVKLTALTTVLAAVIALPFTLIRLKLSRDQIRHASESLYNDKMNTAVADLYAQRQVTKWTEDKAENGWEDDIPRRNGAIDRLKGLTDENPDLRPRVDRLLSVYLRELSLEYPAQKPPKDANPDALGEWAGKLKPVRSDMENAAQTLSRLDRGVANGDSEHLPDFKGMNLQGFNLSGLSLNRADLSGSQLEGANLSKAQLKEANLVGAQLQGSDLSGGQLEGADLNRAKLQGAFLLSANLQKAVLNGAQLSGAHIMGARMIQAQLINTNFQGTELVDARFAGARFQAVQFDQNHSIHFFWLVGASFREIDFRNIPDIKRDLNDVFGDASVKLPADTAAPAHWAKTKLKDSDFETAWRAFQRSLGQDPDDPK